MKWTRLVSCALLFLGMSACSKNNSGDPDPGSVPTVQTNPVPAPATATVSFSGTVTSEGTSAVTSRGFCVSPSPNPTINDMTVPGTGATDFAGSSDNFSPSTLYYMRAYATNASGVGYGAVQTFTTPTAWTVSNTAAFEILSTTARIRGTFTPLYPNSEARMNIVYGTQPGPTPANFNSVMSTTTAGNFDYELSPLQPATTYYARAVFTRAGIIQGYGPEISFKTAGWTNTTGGIVFYDKGAASDGWRYLEAAPQGINFGSSTGAQWGCSGTLVSQTQPELGAGPANTARIMAQCAAADCAARLCANYQLNGVSGWFLPSSEELLRMYKSLSQAQLHPAYHWSSTELNGMNAYLGTLGSGGNSPAITSTGKFSNALVRPVRRF
ncbi:hypothetical protein [Flaviaesturariibacter amylovorans]|uniref:DUF1566 domain-containing protein n=1 Tax=Flaviaesturariibacter amylovorans TaxID=1084520 RepID=A0ABP8GJ24_9BACT